MSRDISKLCSDHLRQFAQTHGCTLKASHARELVAGCFGYNSHAALLAEKKHPLDRLENGALLVIEIDRLDQRRASLSDLDPKLPSSYDIAHVVEGFLKDSGLFSGKIGIASSLKNYITDYLLQEEDNRILDDLSGVMAETNAYFDDAYYEEVVIEESEDGLLVTVSGQYGGSNDPDRPFCGDRIDMTVTIEMDRAAGRAFYTDPLIQATGSVNDDWVDPELKYRIVD